MQSIKIDVNLKTVRIGSLKRDAQTGATLSRQRLRKRVRRVRRTGEAVRLRPGSTLSRQRLRKRRGHG